MPGDKIPTYAMVVETGDQQAIQHTSYRRSPISQPESTPRKKTSDKNISADKLKYVRSNSVQMNFGFIC
jgi:hypothetical protein